MNLKTLTHINNRPVIVGIDDSLIQQEINMKWFAFSQNNSGGYFADDENVCEMVFIQAENAKMAVCKAEKFMDNSDSCPCCGDRWNFWVDDSDGSENPEYYGESVHEITKTWSREKAILHYADGRKETVLFKDESA